MGTKALRKIQIGLESAAAQGDPVPATAALLGALTMVDSPTIHRPVEERGVLAEFARSVKVANLAEMTFEGDATFEQIIYLLNMGILGGWELPISNTPTQAKHLIGAAYTDLPNAIDDDTETYATLSYVAATDYILICSAAKFRAIKVDIGSVPNAVVSAISAIECSDGDGGWESCTLIKDGTLGAGGTKSMAVDGIINFVPHADWASDTVDGDTGYWIRIKWTANWTASVRINEFYTIPLACSWLYTPNIVTAGIFDSFTIEYGDDIAQWEAEFCMAKSIEISGAMAEAMKVKAEIFGRKMTSITDTGFTTGITPPDVESIPAQKALLYIDDEDGVMGDSPITGTLITFSYNIATGLSPKRYGDGSIDFSTYGETFRGVELKMTVAFNAGMAAERANFDGETLRLIRIKATGSTVDGVEKSLILDFCGIITNWATLSEREGEDIVEITLSTQLGTNYTNLFEVEVVNTLATLP